MYPVKKNEGQGTRQGISWQPQRQALKRKEAKDCFAEEATTGPVTDSFDLEKRE